MDVGKPGSGLFLVHVNTEGRPQEDVLNLSAASCVSYEPEEKTLRIYFGGPVGNDLGSRVEPYELFDAEAKRVWDEYRRRLAPYTASEPGEDD